MPDDEVVYRAQGIEISKTLARFRGVTYPINGIGSVRVVEPDRMGAVVFGVILWIIALLIFAGRSANDPHWVWVMLTIVGAVILFSAWGKPYKLMLRTASGDQQAYESSKKAELFAIKDAIERAVVLRG